MKHLSRLPLYLGLTVFILSVLVTSITLRQNKSLTSTNIRASQDGAQLSLIFTNPNIVSLSLISAKEVSGVDVTLKFDQNKVIVMPSSLSGGATFKTTGGKVDADQGIFNFSAIAKTPSTNGIVATFNIRLKNDGESVSSRFDFDTAQEKTAVLDKASQQNILTQADGTNFSLSSQ